VLLRSLDGEAGLLPGCEATLEVKYGRIARGEERGLALSSAGPDHAVESDTVGSVDFHDALSYLVERNVDGARDMAGGILRRSANIDHNRCFSRCAPVVKVGCADAWGLTELRFASKRAAAKNGDEESESESNHVPFPL
jgi:hypothetical protein